MPTALSIFAVQPKRIGGTETFARELSLQLEQAGWKSVLCFDSLPEAEVAEFLQLPNVSIESVKNTSLLKWGPTKKVFQLLRRYRPDILHLHFTGFIGFYPWLAALMSVKRVYITDHSSRPSGYVLTRAPLWKRLLVRLINRPVAKVICVSQYGLRCMRTLDLLSKDKFELVYNAVDVSRADTDPEKGRQFRRRFSIPEDRRVVLQVSWVIPEKGIGDLLQVGKKVLSQEENVHFVIVGDGADKDRYMAEANAMGIGDSLTWTGLVKDPFGEGVFNAADVVCQLSRWEELFGWMIAEAMSFSKPVVATRVGGVPELVDDSETGYLVDLGDIRAAAERILDLIQNDKLRERLGSAAVIKVHKHFELKRNVRQLLRVYGVQTN